MGGRSSERRLRIVATKFVSDDPAEGSQCGARVVLFRRKLSFYAERVYKGEATRTTRDIFICAARKLDVSSHLEEDARVVIGTNRDRLKGKKRNEFRQAPGVRLRHARFDFAAYGLCGGQGRYRGH